MPNPIKSADPVALPWWRERMLWLVLGGPLVVVIASFVTLTLAIMNPDPVLQPGRAASAENVAGPQKARTDSAHLPAQQARNHAATGGQ